VAGDGEDDGFGRHASTVRGGGCYRSGMGGIHKTARGDASVATLHREYRWLDRRLRVLWLWGRAGRLVRRVARVVLYAAALLFAVLSCTRAYAQIVHGLGGLHRM